jgi:hypothetical protein
LKQPNLFDGIIVDNFAGGGGASTGIKQAMGGNKRIKTATTHLLHASDSIVSRIFEMTEQVPVLGPDHRRKMAQSV